MDPGPGHSVGWVTNFQYFDHFVQKYLFRAQNAHFSSETAFIQHFYRTATSFPKGNQPSKK